MGITIANKGFGGKVTFTNRNAGGIFRMKYSLVPLLLDTYTGAAAAYSLRKLRNSYSGAAIRVRRSSDNVETDIGFTSSGGLDETALTAFVGVNSGFVTAWYDQTNNTRNAIQATAANQPRIINAGTVERDGGKIAIFFNGTSYRMGASNLPALSSSSSSFYFVGRATATSTNPFDMGILTVNSGAAYSNGLTPSFTIAGGVTAGTQARIYWNGAYGINGVIDGNLYGVFSTIVSGATTIEVYRNNVLKQTGTRATGTWLTTAFGVSFGARTTALYRSGYASEFILYSTSNSNRTQIEQNINNYYGLY